MVDDNNLTNHLENHKSCAPQELQLTGIWRISRAGHITRYLSCGHGVPKELWIERSFKFCELHQGCCNLQKLMEGEILRRHLFLIH